MSAVVIVCISEYLEVSCHELAEEFGPTREVLATVNDRLVPCLCYSFNSLAVAQPPHVREVRSNQVKLFLHLPRPRDKRCVGQRQGHVVLPQHFHESGIKPVLVSNLECKFATPRKLLQEGNQHCEKIILLREFPAVEGGKLKDHRTKLWTENIHCFHELFEFRIGSN